MPYRILVIDNDEHIRRSLKIELEAADYEVLQAKDAAEAREILERELIHLAIVDIRLTDDDDPNDISGLNLCKEIDPVIAKIVHTAHPPKDLLLDAKFAKIRIETAERPLTLYLIAKEAPLEDLLEAVARVLAEEFEIIPQRRIAVLTSGGDSPGMNAAIWGLVRAGLDNGVEVLGVRDGYRGLVEDNMDKLRWDTVSEIMGLSGTVLGTARMPEFRDDPAVRQQAVDNIIRKGITGLVVIGGDGSMNGARALAQDLAARGKKLLTVGIPGTIDNDLIGDVTLGNNTDMTLGAETAANAMLRSLKDLMMTARAIRRVFVVDVMGACCGYLALTAALGSGADAVLIPETLVEVNPNSNLPWKQRVDPIRTRDNLDKRLSEVVETLKASFAAGKRYGLVIMAEGCGLLTNNQQPCLDADYVKRYLENEINAWSHARRPDVRKQVLGHAVRGEAPHAFDIQLGARLGAAAIKELLQGHTEVMVGWSEAGGVISVPFDEVTRQSNRPPREIWQERPKWQEMLELQEALACPPQLRDRLRARGNRFVQ